MDEIKLTKADLRERLIPLPINRGAVADYYERNEQVYCRRTFRGVTEVLVLKLGVHPVLKHVCVYWGDAS